MLFFIIKFSEVELLECITAATEGIKSDFQAI